VLEGKKRCFFSPRKPWSPLSFSLSPSLSLPVFYLFPPFQNGSNDIPFQQSKPKWECMAVDTFQVCREAALEKSDSVSKSAMKVPAFFQYISPSWTNVLLFTVPYVQNLCVLLEILVRYGEVHIVQEVFRKMSYQDQLQCSQELGLASCRHRSTATHNFYSSVHRCFLLAGSHHETRQDMVFQSARLRLHKNLV
jgi:hypothetical protein